MNQFCELYWRLDATTKTSEKTAALLEYFEIARPEDAVWAIWFLSGNRFKRLLTLRQLRQWAIERAGLSEWLFAECYDRVGDLAETISLVLPPPQEPKEVSLSDLLENDIMPLAGALPFRQKATMLRLWNELESPQRFVLGKLITGGFRVGVSKQLLQRALANWTGIKPTIIAHRMMGNWRPNVDFYHRLINPVDDGSTAISQPYPFFLANPIKAQDDLFQPRFGNPQDWIAEWKWDGVRAQVIKREGKVFIWSRGEELVTHQFPEIEEAGKSLPDGTVLDGEILGWSEVNNAPLEFRKLQNRLGRKKLSSKVLAGCPVILIAFDLIEFEGEDIRSWPLDRRQKTLHELVSDLSVRQGRQFLFAELESGKQTIRLPKPVPGNTWEAWAEQRQQSRTLNVEGLMLKRRSSTYQVNRPVGDWWKWKVDPITVDAVLTLAVRGHGRRAHLYSDYTFSIWDDDELVTFASAYSGLTDKEMREVDAFIRKNKEFGFGPVTGVKPELVFELAFEKIYTSNRHKSGITVRFPRIVRWRRDKKPKDANSLDQIKAMIDT